MEETGSFEDFFKEYYSAVYRLCRGYTDDPATALDLTQETFAAAWSNWNKFRFEASRTTWLYRIAVNTCLGSIRKHQRQSKTLSEFAADAALGAEPPDDGKVESLYRAISLLPEADRVVIMLVLEGLSYAEIGSITGIQEGTLAVRIHRVRKQLYKLMSKDESV